MATIAITIINTYVIGHTPVIGIAIINISHYAATAIVTHCHIKTYLRLHGCCRLLIYRLAIALALLRHTLLFCYCQWYAVTFIYECYTGAYFH